jgi:hypothetical protein
MAALVFEAFLLPRKLAHNYASQRQILIAIPIKFFPTLAETAPCRIALCRQRTASEIQEPLP